MDVEGKKTQIMFAPNIENIEELGANWYNLVMDIAEYLRAQGFVYMRTLGFVNDRELSEEELGKLGHEIIELALGSENLLYLNANIIDNVQSITL
ncbi:MAG: hypothetical protein K2N81_04295 [Acetatifactor sp.]|nr:hypothetical protein [Acetatifactor sp.]